MQKQSKRRMKALVVTALGDPTAPLDDSVLKLSTQQPVPKLPAGHVRIRTVAASLNFADMLQVQGSYQVGLPQFRKWLCGGMYASGFSVCRWTTRLLANGAGEA
jgi:hypothetical protein